VNNRLPTWLPNLGQLALPRAAWRAVLTIGQHCRLVYTEHFAHILCIAEFRINLFNKPLHQILPSPVATFCAPYPLHAAYLLAGWGFLFTAVASS
jgi:hypothetical protein